MTRREDFLKAFDAANASLAEEIRTRINAAIEEAHGKSKSVSVVLPDNAGGTDVLQQILNEEYGEWITDVAYMSRDANYVLTLS